MPARLDPASPSWGAGSFAYPDAGSLPVVYVNDTFGQWRSDRRCTVAHCTAKASKGRRASLCLRPTQDDFFVLKPKHSGFYDTTLETLLDDLRVRRVIVTGIAGNLRALHGQRCLHARPEDLAPADCIVSNTRLTTRRHCARSSWS
ncbi:MAG: isochorismatase family protein [Vicinamibacteraceae bacterium]